KIYLPRVGVVSETEAATASPALSSSGRGGETILIVEDEADVRKLGRQYLEMQGYKVLEAADGASAIQVSNGHTGPIHLLLTDVIMPGMNGRELAQRISSLRTEIKVLYMSGYTESAIGHNGTLDAGITLLQKPFTLPALKATVREVLDSALHQEVSMPARTLKFPLVRARERMTSPCRAQRFNLHLPLKYRLLGENAWRDGTTENISRSGMLFRAEELIPPNAQ